MMANNSASGNDYSTGSGSGRKKEKKSLPRPGFEIRKCYNYHHKDILMCVRGPTCWNLHDMKSAAHLNTEDGRRPDEVVGPNGVSYNPKHPYAKALMKARESVSGNEQGQGQEATSVQNLGPQVTLPGIGGASSEEEARRRIAASLDQRASNRAHREALQDPELQRILEGANRIMNRALSKSKLPRQ